MRRAFTLLIIFGLAVPCFAGNIIGTITDSGKPVAQGVKVDIACGDKAFAAQTDANGSFKVFVPEKGKCTLKVSYQGQTPSMEINSYDGSVQYDLLLEKQGAEYSLKRK